MSAPLQCHYCDALVAADDIEQDHWPAPERHGGDVTVSACRTCHGMKDRFPLDKWPEEWKAELAEAWPLLPRSVRIWLAKASALALDAARREG